MPGVSIVIPCHNGAARLPPALAHLAAQQLPEGTPCELLLIDNNCSDETVAVAKRCWPADHPVALQILSEPQQGIRFACTRCLDAARYDIVVFVHDDNWLDPNYIRTALAVMAAHPEVGALGGQKTEQCEIKPPAWFDRVKIPHYTIGPAIDHECDFTEHPGIIAGAGLVVRKSAWKGLRDSGFRFGATARDGFRLDYLEDAELTLALRLAGWRLRHDPALRMKHFLIARRLDWSYLRRLNRGRGFCTPSHDPYLFAFDEQRSFGDRGRRMPAIRGTWWFQSFAMAKFLAKRAPLVAAAALFNLEGRPSVLRIEYAFGRLVALLKTREYYDRAVRRVRETRWRRN